MKVIPSILYSTRQFLRNSKRSLAIMIGIVISITLISGIFIAGENLTEFSIKNGLDDVKFDYVFTFAETNDTSKDDVLDAFKTVQNEYDDLNILKDIYTTSTRAFLNISDENSKTNWIPETIRYQRGFAITKNNTSPTLDDFLPQVAISAMDNNLINNSIYDDIISFDKENYDGLNRNEIMIDQETLNKFGINIGDQINLNSFLISNNFTIRNVTVVGTFEILDLRNFVEAFYPDDFILENKRYNTLLENIYFSSGTERSFIIANLDYGRELMANLSSTDPENFVKTIKFRFLTLFSHENLPIYDLDVMYTYFDAIRNRLILEIGTTNGITVEDNIFGMIEQIENQLTLFEAFSLIISIPTLMTGLFLTITLYDLTLELRRREFGIIKSRGATSRQTSLLFLSETAFIGIFGGLIGAFSGLGISYGIISKILGEAFPEFLASQPMSINWSIIIGAIVGAFILIFISIFKPIKNFSNMNIVDTTVHYQEEEAMKPLKGKSEWISLILGLIPIGLLIFNNTTTSQSSAKGLEAVFGNLLQLFGEALIWLSPFLLTYALVKIIAGRSIKRFSKMSQKIASLFSKSTSYLVSRDITRNPKRSTRLIFIISITICFGITSLIVTTSEENYEYGLAYLQVGADLNIQVNDGIDYSFSETIANYSSDVNSISTVVTTSASVLGSSTANLYVNGINTNSLLNVSELEKQYFDGENPEKILNQIEITENGILLPKIWAEKQFYNLGDSIPISFSSINSDSGFEIINFKIVGFVNLLPGISNLISSSKMQDVYVNFNFLNHTIIENLTSSSYRFLVDIVDNPIENSTTIGHNLDNTYIGEIRSVQIMEENYLNIQQRKGAFVSAIDMMAFQFPFLLIISTMGIIVISYLIVIEKRRESALMRVRGVSRGSLIKMQFSEGLVLIIFGIIIGSIGFFIGYIMNLQLDSIDQISKSLNITRPYSVPWNLIILQNALVFIIFALAMIGTSFWESKNSNIGKISEVLRNA
ncbi:MAG: FtsX-like permease family protein [Promethearchaeota archaeon]